MMMRTASPSAFLPKIEASSARSRESFDTSCYSDILVVLLFSALVQLVAVLEEPEVRDLLHQYLGHAFLLQVSSLMLAAQVVKHPHLHLHPCLVHELDVLGFRSDMAKVTFLFGWPDRSRDLVVS